MSDEDKQKLMTLFFVSLKVHRPTPAYASEFKNLVTRAAGTQWNNFLHNIFHPEMLSDTRHSVLSSQLRSYVDNLDENVRLTTIAQISQHTGETALKCLLKERFESEEKVSKTLQYLQGLSIVMNGESIPLLDLERLKDRMTHILNMYNATSYRTWEGTKLVEELGYRYWAEQTFLGDVGYAEEFLNLKDKHFINPQGRNALMKLAMQTAFARIKTL